MTDTTAAFEPAEDIFTLVASDEALEAAALTTPVAAVSFTGAPTVSILVVCCSNDSATAAS
jgi:hypothetical protein